MRFAVPVLLLLAPLAPAQTADEVKATLKFIDALRDPATGAYAVNPPKAGEKPTPSLRAVNGAAKAIKYLGGEVTDKEKLQKFVMGCFDEKTGAFAEPGVRPDVATTSVGVMAAVEVGVPKEMIKKAMEYLAANAKTFEEIRIAAAAVEAFGVKDSGVDVKPWVKEAYGELNTAALARDAGGAAACILRLRPELMRDDAKKEALDLIHAGRRADGGWDKVNGAKSDAETTYRVMRALMLLKQKPKDAAGVAKFFASCRRADGGYGVDAAAPSSMSGVYYFAVVRHWLSEMEKK